MKWLLWIWHGTAASASSGLQNTSPQTVSSSMGHGSHSSPQPTQPLSLTERCARVTAQDIRFSCVEDIYSASGRFEAERQRRKHHDVGPAQPESQMHYTRGSGGDSVTIRPDGGVAAEHKKAQGINELSPFAEAITVMLTHNKLQDVLRECPEEVLRAALSQVTTADRGAVSIALGDQIMKNSVLPYISEDVLDFCASSRKRSSTYTHDRTF